MKLVSVNEQKHVTILLQSINTDRSGLQGQMSTNGDGTANFHTLGAPYGLKKTLHERCEQAKVLVIKRKWNPSEDE